LKQGAVEQNKIAAWLFKKLGVIPAAFLAKAGGLVPAGWLLLNYPDHWGVFLGCGLLGLGSIYTLYNNIKTLRDF
jgi:hypothetical protein